MSNNLYRCGCCGAPIDINGDVLHIIGDLEEGYNDAELLYGNCCIDKIMSQEKSRHVTVTRDMASDAQDMSLEVWITNW